MLIFFQKLQQHSYWQIPRLTWPCPVKILSWPSKPNNFQFLLTKYTQVLCSWSSLTEYEWARNKMLMRLPTQGSETPHFEAYKKYIKVTKQNTNNSSELCFRIWQKYLAAIQKKVRFLKSLSLNTSWPKFLFPGMKIAFAPYWWINIHCRTQTPDLEELYNFMTIPELRRYQLSTIAMHRKTIKCF